MAMKPSSKFSRMNANKKPTREEEGMYYAGQSAPTTRKAKKGYPTRASEGMIYAGQKDPSKARARLKTLKRLASK
jgi:hypothetical protein